MPLPITAIFAGLLAIWLTVLQIKVIQQRRAKGIVLGDGGDRLCESVIRGHANAVETIPIFLILLAASESLGAPAWVLVGLAAVFTIGRVLHGIHFMQLRDGITLRFVGMVLTFVATGLMAVGAIAHGVEGMS